MDNVTIQKGRKKKSKRIQQGKKGSPVYEPVEAAFWGWKKNHREEH